MFENSLVESSGRCAKRAPWTTAFSFAVQMLLAGILVLFPLIYTEALPEQHLLRILDAPVPPPSTRAAPRVARPAKPAGELDLDVLRPPPEIPKTIAVIRDEEAPISDTGGGPVGVPGGVPNRASSSSLINELVRNTAAASPRVVVTKVRVSSGVAQGLLLHEMKPQYPPLARQARIQGTVVLQAVIGKDGTVQNLHVISGHPMLTQAAMDAVKQWRYKPYYLNGEPVEVDTQININFTLSGG